MIHSNPVRIKMYYKNELSHTLKIIHYRGATFDSLKFRRDITTVERLAYWPTNGGLAAVNIEVHRALLNECRCHGLNAMRLMFKIFSFESMTVTFACISKLDWTRNSIRSTYVTSSILQLIENCSAPLPRHWSTLTSLITRAGINQTSSNA